ncbi:MAG: hypothetical protein GNW80_04985 [Asgard group archaeon]|nr:hypothetical protein [Asgard group archaeon]
MSKRKDKKEDNITFTKYLKKLLDPIPIFSLIFMIYSINILVFYFRTPIIISTDLLADTVTYYFWNGNFSILDIGLETTTEGFAANFPAQLSWVFITAIIFFLLLTTIVTILSVFNEKITRIKISQRIIWPLFIISSIIIGCVVVFLYWGASLKTEDFLISYGRVVMLNLVVSIIIVIFVLVFSAYVSSYKSNREKYSVNSKSI